MRGSRLHGNDRGIRGNDACDQCTDWRGDGAMGCCRWLGGGRVGDYVDTAASIRLARESKSSEHFWRMASMLRAASSPKAFRPPPSELDKPRCSASGSKNRSLTSTSARTSAQRQLRGRSSPARTHVSSSSHAFSAKKVRLGPNSCSIRSSRWRRPRYAVTIDAQYENVYVTIPLHDFSYALRFQRFPYAANRWVLADKNMRGRSVERSHKTSE